MIANWHMSSKALTDSSYFYTHIKYSRHCFACVYVHDHVGIGAMANALGVENSFFAQ